ncbi:hypothetical protein [Erythrobacter sp. YT30]|uniref:hypothetical protein n=1 Tax=Erythrobacter sp. YT30 TaxID=1735012 RepID=UPI0012E34BF3|nr:hypothetical protein [Erythrobacter sp. YT30]
MLRSAAVSLALAAGAIGAQGAHAQSFNLPEPTPTPTPAPQGPVDVRSGVPIAPRSIPDQTSQPAQPSEEAQTPPPSQSNGASPSGAGNETLDVTLPPASPVTRPEPSTSASPPAQRSQSGASQGTRPQTVAPTAPAEVAAPGPLTSESEGTSPVLPQEGASSPAPSIDVGNVALPASEPEPVPMPLWIWAAALLALALLAGAFAFMRSHNSKTRRPAMAIQDQAAMAPPLSPANSTESGPQAAPSIPANAAPRIDLELDITNATRSLMMFTLDCRITLHNRSDRGVRDISVLSQLVCAQSAAPTQANGADLPTLETIERIGPQQCRTITAQLQLPLKEVRPMRQAQKPLFIPLALVGLKVGNADVRQRSFVIGLPSAATTGRVHPIPLDTPPGGIIGLLAREVKAETPKPQAA